MANLLFTLPLEIRTMVYKHVLNLQSQRILHEETDDGRTSLYVVDWQASTNDTTHHTKLGLLTALSHVNKQLREETLPIFYAQHLHFREITSLFTFLKSMAADHHVHLHSITVDHWLSNRIQNSTDDDHPCTLLAQAAPYLRHLCIKHMLAPPNLLPRPQPAQPQMPTLVNGYTYPRDGQVNANILFVDAHAVLRALPSLDVLHMGRFAFDDQEQQLQKLRFRARLVRLLSRRLYTEMII